MDIKAVFTTLHYGILVFTSFLMFLCTQASTLNTWNQGTWKNSFLYSSGETLYLFKTACYYLWSIKKHNKTE